MRRCTAARSLRKPLMVVGLAFLDAEALVLVLRLVVVAWDLRLVVVLAVVRCLLCLVAVVFFCAVRGRVSTIAINTIRIRLIAY